MYKRQDTRSLTVTFDNGVPQQTYGVADIGSALPEASKTGYLFRGWLFDKTGDERDVYRRQVRRNSAAWLRCDNRRQRVRQCIQRLRCSSEWKACRGYG